MTPNQINLLSEIVIKINRDCGQQMAHYAQAHGPEFAASAMLSVAAEMAGTALALCKDPETRNVGTLSFLLAVKSAATEAGAGFATEELLDKIMEKS